MEDTTKNVKLKSTKIQVTLSPEMKNRLSKLAVSKELPLSRLITSVMSDYANKQEVQTHKATNSN